MRVLRPCPHDLADGMLRASCSTSPLQQTASENVSGTAVGSSGPQMLHSPSALVPKNVEVCLSVSLRAPSGGAACTQVHALRCALLLQGNQAQRFRVCK